MCSLVDLDAQDTTLHRGGAENVRVIGHAHVAPISILQQFWRALRNIVDVAELSLYIS